jgi:hypothetical protein
MANNRRLGLLRLNIANLQNETKSRIRREEMSYTTLAALSSIGHIGFVYALEG